MSIARCRPFRSGDEESILALYRTVFNLNLPLQNWRWSYEQMPEGPAIIVVAENEQGIVGHYAVQPRPFWLRGTPCLAGLAIGTMVHPSARNVATLVEMARLAYSLCRERGLAFLYAFPIGQAYRIRQALLGWQPLPQLTEWEGPLASFAEPFRSQVRTWNAPPLEGCAYALLPIDKMSQKAVCGQRNPEWLRWRFSQKPDAEYVLHVADSWDSVQGYAVSKRYERDGVWYGHIVDWQVASTDVPAEQKLIASVWQQFVDWRVEKVSCWALPKSSLSAQLPDAGLTLTGRKTNFTYLYLSPEADTELASGDAWNIYMGDSDVY